MRNSSLRQSLIGYGLSLILVAVGVAYVYLHRHDLDALGRVRISDVVSLSLVVLGFFLATGATFYLFLSTASLRLAPMEWITLTFLTNFVNYLLPTRPGAVVKALYLKKAKGFPLARFSAVAAAQGLVSLFTAGLGGLLLLGFFSSRPGGAPLPLVGICVLTVAASGLPFMLRWRPSRPGGRLARFLEEALAGFQLIKDRKGGLLAAGLSVFAQYLLSALMFVLAYRALGSPISFSVALLVGIFLSLSNFFTITPNNLGIQELVIAYLYSLTGMDFAGGLLGAGLIRVVHVALTFTVTPVLTVLFLRRQGLGLDAIWPSGKRE
jgi:uncharacterized membrane protein YbhN (UPF0104 family)